MRISSYDLFSKVQNNLARIQGDMATTQFKMSTGKEFNRASEAPIKAKQSRMLEHAMSRVDQFQKNNTDAKGVLETVGTALSKFYDIMENTQEEILKAGNEIYNDADLKTISTYIDNAIGQLVMIGNSKHLNRYIFSGEKILTEPFDYDGANVNYNGNDNPVSMEVSPYIDVKVIESGNRALKQAIDDLIVARDKIAAGDQAGIQASIAANKKNMDEVVNYIADVGVRMEGLEIVSEGFREQKLNLEERRSEVEDIDFSEVMVEYSILQRTWQSSLKATSMMFSTSIMDYI